MPNPSPTCLVNSGSTLNGVNVTAASTVTVALADTAGVKQWSLVCLNTDELISPTTITAGLTIDNIAKTATFTAPAAGSAMLFQSIVNNGLNANGVVDPSLTTKFGVYVLTATTYRVGAFDERTEGSAQYGWIAKLNPLIRGVVTNPASAGAGMVFSGGAYNVVAADGSITVNAHSLQVGVISDTNHGSRGNGSLHSVADGTHNGFMPSAMWSLVNGATASATNSALAQRDGSGGCAFGAVSSTNLTATGTVSLNATTLGNMLCSGPAEIVGTLKCDSLVTATAGLTVSGATLTTNTLSCTLAATVGSTLTVNGTLDANANLAVTGVSTLLGNVTCGGTLGVTGTTTCAALNPSGDITFQAAGKLIKFSATRTFVRQFPCANSAQPASNWSYVFGGAQQVAIPANSLDTLQYRIRIPHGATITNVRVYLQGFSTHAGSFPTGVTVPLAQLVAFTSATLASLTMASASDPSASKAAYEAVHHFDLGAITSPVVNNTSNVYTVIVAPEIGANAAAGLVVGTVEVTYTATQMDDGGN